MQPRFQMLILKVEDYIHLTIKMLMAAVPVLTWRMMGASVEQQWTEQAINLQEGQGHSSFQPMATTAGINRDSLQCKTNQHMHTMHTHTQLDWISSVPLVCVVLGEVCSL